MERAIPITPRQSKRINKLVRQYCCNCDGSCCLLLDDGDRHDCVQLISTSGIYCSYFLGSVLPNDEALMSELLRTERTKRCEICGGGFVAGSNRQKYCKSCAATVRRVKEAQRKRQSRMKPSADRQQNNA